MDRQVIDSICQEVYRRFPEVKGAHPKVSSYSGDKSLLIFSGSAQGPNGKTINHTVRVVASANGKIEKMSTSR
ncbi:MAG: hypothetical protein LWX83_15210 [Anaerolineae bacterium]|nr:hypothetical protein [Anaerolineae bacterium]